MVVFYQNEIDHPLTEVQYGALKEQIETFQKSRAELPPGPQHLSKMMDAAVAKGEDQVEMPSFPAHPSGDDPSGGFTFSHDIKDLIGGK